MAQSSLYGVCLSRKALCVEREREKMLQKHRYTMHINFVRILANVMISSDEWLLFFAKPKGHCSWF